MSAAKMKGFLKPPRGDEKRFVLHADDKLTAFLEQATRAFGELS
jgi:hypothetical protein